MIGVTMNESLGRRFLVLVLWVSLSTCGWAKTIATWEFTESAQGWVGNQSVKGLTVGSEGLAFTSTGIDPWIEKQEANSRCPACGKTLYWFDRSCSACNT